jgi:hypothetical protein
MKKAFRISLFFSLVFFSFTAALACSCVLNPLSKRFKKAEAVFIGKYAEEIPEDNNEIQNAKDGLPVLEVVKAWKGVKKEYIAIDFAEFPKSVGNCLPFYRFEEDKEYLVFAYGKDLKVETVCSDTRPLTAGYDYTTEEISRLNNFWFRFRARLNFF